MKTVIHMAAECMLFEALGPDEFEAALAKFAELVRAQENEACALIADEAEPYNAADLIRKRVKA